MTTSKRLKKLDWQTYLIYTVLAAGLAFLLLYRLGSLASGVSAAEAKTFSLKLGWHGLYHNPLYLPLNVLRSIDFFLLKHHTAFLLRLPNAILGGLTIVSFSAIAYLWHGKRTAFYASIMFACSAWVLHVSRLSSYDITYLWAITSALFSYVCLDEFRESKLAWYLNLFILGLIVTIPGLIWLTLLMLFFERGLIRSRLKQNKLIDKTAGFILVILWLPLTIIRLHFNHTYRQWLGLPEHFPSIIHQVKDFIAVPVHLLFRGPLEPNVWLGKAPILDIFALAMLLLGAYTYARRLSNSRSRLLGALLLLSTILIGLNGSVSFSLVVPLAYLLVAMGLSYLTHAWRKVFPRNPVAKSVGVGLIVLAITLSCAYNLSAYFIAWPHNPTTYTTFDQSV